MNHAAVRSVLLAVLVVGALGSVGPATTYSLFTNTHDGTGTVSAADNIKSGGNGGGNNGNGNGNNNEFQADAGGSYTVNEDKTVELSADGSSGKGNNKNYDYKWEITSGPGELQPPVEEQQVTYDAPANVDGDATAEVKVTVTNNGNTATDRATVDVIDSDSSSCDATSLTFCSVDINDQDTRYSIPYEVGDPNGEFNSVNITLEKASNGNVRDTTGSVSTGDTLTVSDNSKMNKEYTVRVELYNTSGRTVECREALSDPSDGTDPNVTTC